MPEEIPLRQWRKRNRFRLDDLAAQTGFTSAWISQIERGKRRILAARMALLSRQLEAPVRELFGDGAEVALAERLLAAGLTDDDLDHLGPSFYGHPARRAQ